MTNETEKLLSLIYQANGQIKVENGQLLVAPLSVAQRFGEQIKKLKPEILIALNHCPVCVRELVVKIEDIEAYSGKTGRHSYCPDIALKGYGHYDNWQF